MKLIRQKTRKQYSAEEKIRIVIEGLRGDLSIAELCRKEGIAQSMYYAWSKEFLEAGKSRLAGNTKRQADSDEVAEMRKEMEQLKLPSGRTLVEQQKAQKNLVRLGGRDVERLIRRTPEEKMEIIHLVEHSDLSIRKTLAELGVPRSSFYRWYQRYQQEGFEGLLNKKPRQKQFWNRIPGQVREQVVELALKHPEMSPRQLAWHFVDERGLFSLGIQRVSHPEGL